jgi:hypothetical protein
MTVKKETTTAFTCLSSNKQYECNPAHPHPIEVKSTLFSGKMLFLVRNCCKDAPYFQNKRRKYAYYFQGKFLKTKGSRSTTNAYYFGQVVENGVTLPGGLLGRGFLNGLVGLLKTKRKNVKIHRGKCLCLLNKLFCVSTIHVAERYDSAPNLCGLSRHHMIDENIENTQLLVPGRERMKVNVRKAYFAKHDVELNHDLVYTFGIYGDAWCPDQLKVFSPLGNFSVQRYTNASPITEGIFVEESDKASVEDTVKKIIVGVRYHK